MPRIQFAAAIQAAARAALKTSAPIFTPIVSYHPHAADYNLGTNGPKFVEKQLMMFSRHTNASTGKPQRVVLSKRQFSFAAWLSSMSANGPSPPAPVWLLLLVERT
jgi:hypothetical protein